MSDTAEDDRAPDGARIVKWVADDRYLDEYGCIWKADVSSDQEDRQACGRCGKPTTGEFCATCVDRCHESTELGHTCAVCQAPPVVGYPPVLQDRHWRPDDLELLREQIRNCDDLPGDMDLALWLISPEGVETVIRAAGGRVRTEQGVMAGGIVEVKRHYHRPEAVTHERKAYVMPWEKVES
ncbi:MAG: hypothetical protein J2P24_00230 [Streptosporangiales bacterium]|nr:hypothetical protein [Streptosporangiales bacterium]